MIYTDAAYELSPLSHKDFIWRFSLWGRNMVERTIHGLVSRSDLDQSSPPRDGAITINIIFPAAYSAMTRKRMQ